MKKEDTGVVIINGVEWHQKKTYSEEEVIELLITFNDVIGGKNKRHQIINFFNRFKNI